MSNSAVLMLISVFNTARSDGPVSCGTPKNGAGMTTTKQKCEIRGKTKPGKMTVG